MKNILLINGHQRHELAKGEYTLGLIQSMEAFFVQRGNIVKSTNVDSKYNIDEQIDLFSWADIIVFQFPVYWMGIPAQFKKYIDDVYMSAYGTLYASDGRNTGGLYGTGGLMKNTHYMFSMTWNAPFEAFNDHDQFFDGLDEDAVFMGLHKAQQFIGMKPLPTFSCFDIMSNPDFEQDSARLLEHLTDVFEATSDQVA